MDADSEGYTCWASTLKISASINHAVNNNSNNTAQILKALKEASERTNFNIENQDITIDLLTFNIDSMKKLLKSVLEEWWRGEDK